MPKKDKATAARTSNVTVPAAKARLEKMVAEEVIPKDIAARYQMAERIYKELRTILYPEVRVCRLMEFGTDAGYDTDEIAYTTDIPGTTK
jgi:hypothetical protein